MRFYFDHNATTPVDPQVLAAFVEAQEGCCGNASSIHQEGQRARQFLEDARRRVAAGLMEGPGGHASSLNNPNQLVFTSGGTEANNLAILGLVLNLTSSSRHVVTTSIEHPAVLEACRHLQRQAIDVTLVPVDASGRVRADAVAAAIRPETVLVSVMHANNETGSVQPLREIAAVIQSRRSAGQTLYFHSDGVQALGKIPVNVQELGIDLYSTSAHKLCAPKGIGALWVRKGVPLRGISFGGRHERERRAGTENVAGAIAFAKAVDLINESERARVADLRDLFEQRALFLLQDARINGTDARLPNTSNIRFPGLSGESIVIALDLKGFAVSSGSACSSGSVEPSPVLLAMGLRAEDARSSVRFSLGRVNDEAQVLALTNALESVIIQMRATKRIAKPAAVREPQEVLGGSR